MLGCLQVHHCTLLVQRQRIEKLLQLVLTSRLHEHTRMKPSKWQVCRSRKAKACCSQTHLRRPDLHQTTAAEVPHRGKGMEIWKH